MTDLYVVSDNVGREWIYYGRFLDKNDCQKFCDELNEKHEKFTFKPKVFEPR